MITDIKAICLISPYPPPYGGMAIQAEKLAFNLEQSGIKILKVRTNPIVSGKSEYVSRIRGLRTIINLLYFLNNLDKALRKSEVVYFMTGFLDFFLWVTLPALLLIKLHKKPIILSARGGNARLFFQKYGWLVKPLFTRLNGITTPSVFLRDVFREAFHLEPVVVPNIADIDQFQFFPREYFRPRLIVTRNLEPSYDIECIIHAFRIVRSFYDDAVLGIAGSGSLRSVLEKKVVELGLKKSVIFYGQVDHKKIQQLYKEYDILVNASKVDNLPGSLLEAFACGLPVVSTNAGGIPYMVENGITGLLVNIGDHKSMAEQVINIVEKPELGKSLAKAALAETRIYSWRYIKPLLFSLFEKVTIY